VKVLVIDLQGGCAHAAAFGKCEGQTLAEAWTLIEAARDRTRRLSTVG
jgi:hypothetical protein